jgi:glycosyltransferase involved in cell wall biosynthesis
MKKIAIVPAYNEEKTVGAVLAEIKEFCRDFDVLVVDDGSTDRTAEIARTVPGARVVSLPFNVGIGGAVQTGFLYARDHGYDLAVQIDADGQYKPAEVRLLLEPILKDEADMVFGSRFMEKGAYRGRAWRRLGIMIFYLTNRLLLGERVTDSTSGFRAYNGKAIALLGETYPDDYPEPEAIYLLRRSGLRVREVPVQMGNRLAGRSSIGFFESIYYMVKVFLAIFVLFLRRPKQRIGRAHG